jgi:hypothetical protein
MGGRLAEPANREGREVRKDEISRPSWDKGRPLRSVLRSVAIILLLVSLTILLVFFVAGCGSAQEGASNSDASAETSSGERSTSRTSSTEVKDRAPATTAPVTTVAPDAGVPEATGSQGGEGESTLAQVAQGEQRGQGGGSAQGTQDVPVAGGDLTVTFLDVGQGNSALIQLPGGENVLVDGGPTEAGPLVVQRLGELGVRELDAVVLSHADEDHVGGLVDVMETVPVETVYDSGYPHSTQIYEEFLAAVEESGARYVETRAGDEVSEDSPAELDFIYPDGLGEGTNESFMWNIKKVRGVDAEIMG